MDEQNDGMRHFEKWSKPVRQDDGSVTFHCEGTLELCGPIQPVTIYHLFPPIPSEAGPAHAMPL